TVPITASTSGGMLRLSPVKVQAVQSETTPKSNIQRGQRDDFILQPSCVILHLDLDPRCRLGGKRETNLSLRRKERRSFVQSNLCRNLCQVGIVRALREVCKHDVSCRSVKPVA